VYKQQIYQIAESNRIEKIDSVARIESKLFSPNWNALAQGSQTRGPRAACGPRNYFVRPAAMSTNLKKYFE